MSEHTTTGNPEDWLLERNPSGVFYVKNKTGKFSIITSVQGLTSAQAEANAYFIIEALHQHAKLKAAAEFGVKLSTAWKHDANPHGDLQPGESAEYDAACAALQTFEEALKHEE